MYGRRHQPSGNSVPGGPEDPHRYSVQKIFYSDKAVDIQSRTLRERKDLYLKDHLASSVSDFYSYKTSVFSFLLFMIFI